MKKEDSSIDNLARRVLNTLGQDNSLGVFSVVHHLIFGVLCGLALMHTLFLLYSYVFDIYPLVAFNFGSVLFYICCAYYKFNNDKSHDKLIALVVLEVCAHALVASYYVGWQSGFSIYVMAITATLAIIASTSIFSRLAGMAILSVVLISCDYYFSQHTPAYQLSEQVLRYTRLVNYGSALTALAMAAMSYQLLLYVANERMEQLANQDLLTGQMNRRAMIEHSERLMEQCLASRVPLCAAIGDLDHFKSINDSFGHSIGDEVLVAVSELMGAQKRQGDLSGRWGGEEFVWLLPNTDLEQARRAMERLRVAVQQLQPASPDTAWHASISIGLVQVQPAEGFDAAISRADLALYRAKAHGRNCVEVTTQSEPSLEHDTSTDPGTPILRA